ncbi:MAG TPA: hypothetical protein VMI75_16595, partial [Polyangiaceae bacterium]|nr:hypothetical protein [Polyangiaceae bacterium]
MRGRLSHAHASRVLLAALFISSVACGTRPADESPPGEGADGGAGAETTAPKLDDFAVHDDRVLAPSNRFGVMRMRKPGEAPP